MVALDEVAELSDDSGPAQGAHRAHERTAPLKRNAEDHAASGRAQSLPERVARLLRSVCKCSRLAKTPRMSCFLLFATLGGQIISLRQKLKALHKLDADREIHGLIREGQRTAEQRQGGERHQLSLFGLSCCAHTFRSLVGVGQCRFQKLCKAVAGNQPAPYDGRYVKRANRHPKPCRNRQLIVEYLEELYATVAEPLPESHGHMMHASDARPTAARLLADKKAKRKKRLQQFRKHRGRRPKVVAQAARHTAASSSQCLRLLPPGSYTEYLNLLRIRHPGAKLGLKLFTKVWGESFCQKLSIRERTQHSVCSVCMRRKLIIRRLGSDRDSLSAQMEAYARHLRQQYADRTMYWQARAVSRMKSLLPCGNWQVTAIVDGMDHCKYRFPRAPIFGSKEFTNVIRPTLDATALIVHGHRLDLFLAPPNIPKNSSFSVEVVLYGLNQLASAGLDGRRVALHLQADNTSREVKNNTTLRALSCLVAARRLASAKVCHLLSGHSHEDVGQFFSSLTSLLESTPVAETPQDFKKILEDFLANTAAVRPLEPTRAVHIIESVREWTLGMESVQQP